jgi:hypothetical protein
MTYTTTKINQNFRIKVNGLNNDGEKNQHARRRERRNRLNR